MSVIDRPVARRRPHGTAGTVNHPRAGPGSLPHRTSGEARRSLTDRHAVRHLPHGTPGTVNHPLPGTDSLQHDTTRGEARG